jgi:hypothetical protein
VVKHRDHPRQTDRDAVVAVLTDDAGDAAHAAEEVAKRSP